MAHSNQAATLTKALISLISNTQSYDEVCAYMASHKSLSDPTSIPPPKPLYSTLLYTTTGQARRLSVSWSCMRSEEACGERTGRRLLHPTHHSVHHGQAVHPPVSAGTRRQPQRPVRHQWWAPHLKRHSLAFLCGA